MGFSIMELAVVLVIVALLLGGLLVPLGAQRDVEFTRAAEKSLTEIREALIGFAAINGRLPCPAQASIANGVANAGIEATLVSGGITYCACTATVDPGVATIGATQCATAGDTVTVGGVLPWATLGLLERDAWGNRYTYHVSSYFTRGINSAETDFSSTCVGTTAPTNASFALCSRGAIWLKSAAGGSDLIDQTKVAAVVVSHGGNLLGAYTTLGTQLASAAAGSDEEENSNGDRTFVSNTTIDDRLTWIPTSQLMNRMMTAGKLP